MRDQRLMYAVASLAAGGGSPGGTVRMRQAAALRACCVGRELWVGCGHTWGKG